MFVYLVIVKVCCGYCVVEVGIGECGKVWFIV